MNPCCSFLKDTHNVFTNFSADETTLQPMKEWASSQISSKIS